MVNSDGEIYRKVESGVGIKVLAELNACSVADIQKALDSYTSYVNSPVEKRVKYEDYKYAVENGLTEVKGIDIRTGKSIIKQKSAPVPPKKTPKYVNRSSKKEVKVEDTKKKGKEVVKMKRATKKRFIYSKDMLKGMDKQLKEGKKWNVIYSNLFDTLDEKPSRAGFRDKCLTRRKELGLTTSKKEAKKKAKGANAIVRNPDGTPKVKEVNIPDYLTKNGMAHVSFTDITVREKLKEARNAQAQKVVEAEQSLISAVYELAKIDVALGDNTDE